MKKVVLKLEFYDEKVKQKAMVMVSGVSGVESISIDMKEKKLTVCGDMDPVKVASRLRKVCPTDMISVGPAKEPEKDLSKDKKEMPRPLLMPPPLLQPPSLPPTLLKKEEPKKDSSNMKEAEQPKKRSSVAGGDGGGGGGGGGGADEKKKEIKMPISISAPPPSLVVPPRPPAPVQGPAGPMQTSAGLMQTSAGPMQAPAGMPQNGQLVKAFANVPPQYQQHQPYQHQPQHPYPPPPPPHHYPHYHQCMPPPPPPMAYYVRSVEDNPNSCVIC